jgi:hypothetical protein
LSTGGYTLQELWTGINVVSTIYDGLTVKPTVAQFWALISGKPTVQQLSVIYGLQHLWTGIQVVSTIYDGLTVKPTVAQFWGLTSTSRPTVQQLYVIYGLQDLWTGIQVVSTIRTGLTSTPTVAQFWALISGKPTVQQLFDGGYIVAEMISGGISVSDFLSSVSSNNTSANDIIDELKEVGYKIVIPAPRITAASFSANIVTLTVAQASPDIPITKYFYSHTSNGGVTWSDYAVVMNTVNDTPLLPNTSGQLLLTGFSTANKLHSFRLRAEASDIISNTSNTYKNLFF